MQLDKHKTSIKTRNFLKNQLEHYINIAGYNKENLFKDISLKQPIIYENNSPRMDKTIKWLNYAHIILKGVKSAYMKLDNKSKKIIELTVKGCTNLEFQEKLGYSSRTIVNYKQIAFINFAINLESSKVNNNCAELPSLVVYKE